MTQEQAQIANEHIRQNCSSDTSEDIRRRKRMAELAAEREKDRQIRGQSIKSASAPHSK